MIEQGVGRIVTQSKVLSHWGVALLIGLMGWAIWLLAELGAVDPAGSLILFTILLFAYLALEISRLHRLFPDRWLLNPIVLCSALTFVLGCGVSNAIYFLPQEMLLAVGLTPDVSSWMSKFIFLVLLAALAMWLGYWSSLAMVFAAWISRQRWLDRLLKRDFRPRTGILLGLCLASLASRLVEIKLGVYGYSSDQDRLMELASVRQYLSLIEWLGKIALAVAALWYYSPNSPPSAKVWLVGLLIYETCFGFLTGYKHQVVLPIIIVGSCKYLRLAQIPWRWVAMVPVAIIAAYVVIEPFRAARYEDASFRGDSLSSISNTMLLAAASDRQETLDVQKAGVALQFLSRISMTHVASLGIEYADTHPTPEGAPEFMQDIFLAPMYAVIPRAIWQSKETSRHGMWYQSEVLGIPDERTSIGMSPFTYLYFAGGGLAVVLGFFVVGIIQRIWAQRFLVTASAGAMLVFLVGLRLLATVDSAYYTLFVELIRFIPLAVAVQYLIFRR